MLFVQDKFSKCTINKKSNLSIIHGTIIIMGDARKKYVKDEDNSTHDLSLHSNDIKENLENVNMDAWYYIYENYVNPELKKKTKC